MAYGIDRAMARFIREGCVERLAEFAEENNLQIMPATARFGPTSVTITLEFAVIDEQTGQPQDKKALAFSQSAFLYGLDPDWLGKCFISEVSISRGSRIRKQCVSSSSQSRPMFGSRW